MDAKVRDELERVLRWAEQVRDEIERDPERSDEFQMHGRAYVGGVLTTLDHLGLISATEYEHWDRRLTEALDGPRGG